MKCARHLSTFFATSCESIIILNKHKRNVCNLSKVFCGPHPFTSVSIASPQERRTGNFCNAYPVLPTPSASATQHHASIFCLAKYSSGKAQSMCPLGLPWLFWPSSSQVCSHKRIPFPTSKTALWTLAHYAFSVPPKRLRLWIVDHVFCSSCITGTQAVLGTWEELNKFSLNLSLDLSYFSRLPFLDGSL